jgi:hypothetical protein
MDPSLLKLLTQDGPVAVVLGVFIFGFVKQWWVPGAMYTDRCKEIERLREVTASSREIANKALDKS